jgi:predicted acyltransferase
MSRIFGKPSSFTPLPAMPRQGQDAIATFPQFSSGGVAPLKSDDGLAHAPARHRVASVDVLRGFTIFWILGGDAIAWSLKEMSAREGGVLSTVGNFLGTQLTHVDWEGFRFYDFIFPLLVFVTGVSIVLSLSGPLQREGRRGPAMRIARRALLLFALGVIYYGGTSHKWPEVRLLGVLQRIALCYLAASLLFLTFRWRGMAVACGSILVGYWALMTLVPVPGIGAGSFAPNANLAWWVDAHFLPGKLWDRTQDPEGLLSTLPAIATCLLGVMAGILLMSDSMMPRQKSFWLIGAGAAMVIAGHIWGLQFPIIKYLWTSSFVLVAGGYSVMLLGVSHHIADVWGQTRWATVFIWIGANAIALYMANNFADFNLLAHRLVGGDIGAFLDRHVVTGTGNFMAALVGLTLAAAMARFLYSRHIFIRV